MIRRPGQAAAYGDTVLLINKDRKTYIRTLEPGGKLDTHLGAIAFDDLVGLPYGSPVTTHVGETFYLLLPQTDDLVRHLRRRSQIIFPKDLGYIALKLGIQPGVRVVEAGTGSGGLTLMLATLVGDSGHVTSYDRRADMQALAGSNLQRAGHAERVTLKLRDIAAGFDETEVDAVFLDVHNPWDYLAKARAALRGAGVLGAIVPTINQVIQLANALYAGPWFMLEVEELLLRQYKTTPARIRPDEQMVGHTGYLIFARAVFRKDPQPKRAQTDADSDEANQSRDDTRLGD